MCCGSSQAQFSLLADEFSASSTRTRFLLGVLLSYQTIQHAQNYSDNYRVSSTEPTSYATAAGLLAISRAWPLPQAPQMVSQERSLIHCPLPPTKLNTLQEGNSKAACSGTIRKIEEGQDQPKRGNHIQVLSCQYLLSGEMPEQSLR